MLSWSVGMFMSRSNIISAEMCFVLHTMCREVVILDEKRSLRGRTVAELNFKMSKYSK